MVSVAEFLSTPLASITVTVRLQSRWLRSGEGHLRAAIREGQGRWWTPVVAAMDVIHCSGCRRKSWSMHAMRSLALVRIGAVAPTVTVAPGETKSELAVNESITGLRWRSGYPAHPGSCL